MKKGGEMLPHPMGNCNPNSEKLHFEIVCFWVMFLKASKLDNSFTLKKPIVTPNFCKQNLSPMHHFKTVNFFTFKISPVRDNLELDLSLQPEQF